MALLLLLPLLLLLSLSPQTTCYQTSCGGTNSTTTAAFESNLNLLLDSFTSTHSTFSIQFKGSNPDRTYGLAQCRGDVSLSDCRICLSSAALYITQECPNYTQATVWLDNCQLRYSDTLFFTTVDYSTGWTLWNVVKAKDTNKFSEVEVELLEKLADVAAFNSSIKFATGTSVVSGLPEIYGLAQCTRDLSVDDCSSCLNHIIAGFSQRVYVGGQVLVNSCLFRYEVYPFFKGEPTTSSSAESLATTPAVHVEKLRP